MEFKVIRNVISKERAYLMYDYFLTNYENGDFNDSQVLGASSFYKDIEVYKLQFDLLQFMQNTTGIRLYPAHNYSRIYNSKSYLTEHFDREACEVSIDICMGYEGEYVWPIWILDDNNNKQYISLKSGDGLIYDGFRTFHGRDTADDRVKKQVNCFLHYVDANGPYQNCILDPR